MEKRGLHAIHFNERERIIMGLNNRDFMEFKDYNGY